MIPISCMLRAMKCFSVTAIRNKSHYESLGLTPHATHADIKSAYYKMSMEFHPDKNKGSEEAAQKFRDITEAYEVLGNLRLRKLYDKGILHTAGPQFAEQAEEMTHDAESRFYRSREQRSRPPPPTGKTPIYNFDEWTHMHYGRAFARREAAKARYESKVGRNVIDRNLFYSELIFLGTVFVLTFFSLAYIGNVSYDVVEGEKVDKNNTHSSKSL